MLAMPKYYFERVCVNGDTYRVRSLKQVSLDFLSLPLSGAEMIL